MNNNRRKDLQPLEEIENDDLLSTNAFVSRTNTTDLNNYEKVNFREYYDSLKVQNNKDTIVKRTNIVEKEKAKTIKTDKETIILLDTRDRDTNAYPNPNHVKMAFGKSFYNVKQIKLVSTEFPNTDQVIRDVPEEIRNNRISWENLEDRDLGIYRSVDISTNFPDTVDITVPDFYFNNHVMNNDYFIIIYECTISSLNGKRFATVIDNNTLRIQYKGGIPGTVNAKVDLGYPNYSVDITPGNYSIKTLSEEFERRMNLVKRRNGNSDLFHFFKVTADLSTDIMTFSSYILTQLLSNPIVTTINSSDITVSSLSHGYKVGDSFLMTGSKTTGGVSNTILNGLFTVKEVINIDSFKYEVNDRANENTSGGGFTVKIGKPDKFRILFLTGKSNIVNNIGFPDEDSGQKIFDPDPISTKTLSISNAIIMGNYIRFSTLEPHNLKGATVIPISYISVSGEVTTTSPHMISDITEVEVSDTDTIPPLKGVFSVIVTGNNTFKLKNITLKLQGSSGYVKHSGDRVNLTHFKSSPRPPLGGFTVENTTSTEFDIRLKVSYIDQSSIPITIIGTGQLIIKHSSHGFKNITSIQQGSLTGRTLITTGTSHGLVGRKYYGLYIVPFGNQAQITFPSNHFLENNDVITVSNFIAGLNTEYFIQRVSNTVVTINTFTGNFVQNTCDVHIGDSVLFSNTDSVPAIVLGPDDSPNFKVLSFGFSEFQFEIELGVDIIFPGTRGIIGRENRICFNRITSSEQGSSDLGGIPLSILNRNYHNISEILNSDEYIIRLQQNFATKSVKSGGDSVVASSKSHGHRVFQSNTFDGTSGGVLFRSISLEGENYVMLTSPNLNTVYSIAGKLLGDVFAKILLSEPPGVMMFNTFISAPKEFNPPLASIKELEFEIKRQDGYPYNFNNTNFSLSISIIESVDRIKDTYISSQTGGSGLY